jgi:hypothetical protein
MNKKFLLIIILLISSKNYNLLAQEAKAKNDFFENHPIDFAVGNFSVGMPFSKVFINRYYPLITLGTEFYYLKGKNSQIFQTATIGGFYNKYNT